MNQLGMYIGPLCLRFFSHHRSLQRIEWSSLCYTAGSYLFYATCISFLGMPLKSDHKHYQEFLPLIQFWRPEVWSEIKVSAGQGSEGSGMNPSWGLPSIWWLLAALARTRDRQGGLLTPEPQGKFPLGFIGPPLQSLPLSPQGIFHLRE